VNLAIPITVPRQSLMLDARVKSLRSPLTPLHKHDQKDAGSCWSKRAVFPAQRTATFVRNKTGTKQAAMADFYRSNMTHFTLTKTPYIIMQPCIGTKDASCVDACPVYCIHPTTDEPEYELVDHLHINPDECIECSACEPACPLSAIFEESALPKEGQSWIVRNVTFFRKQP